MGFLHPKLLTRIRPSPIRLSGWGYNPNAGFVFFRANGETLRANGDILRSTPITTLFRAAGDVIRAAGDIIRTFS
jgi:hypothetical protein